MRPCTRPGDESNILKVVVGLVEFLSQAGQKCIDNGGGYQHHRAAAPTGSGQPGSYKYIDDLLTCFITISFHQNCVQLILEAGTTLSYITVHVTVNP